MPTNAAYRMTIPVRSTLLFFTSQWRVDGEQAIGQRHFDTLLIEIYLVQPRFGERDQHLVFAAGFTDDEQRGAGSIAVYVGDGSDVAVSLAEVDDVATDQIVDVDGVFFEWRALAAGNGDIEPAQRFRVGDGVDTGEFEDDPALVQPMVFKGDRAQKGFPVRMQQGEAGALGKSLGEVGKNVGEQLAVASLGTDEARDEYPVGVRLCAGHSISLV